MPIQVSTKHGFDEWYNNAYGFTTQRKVNNLYLRLAKFEKKYTDHLQFQKAFLGYTQDLEYRVFARIEKISYGFDFPEIEKLEELRGKNIQLVMVGRLVEFKGHRYAIEMAKQLKDRNLQFDLKIVGDGSLFQTLKQQIDRLQLNDCVHLLGYSTQAKEYMMASDIVLIPSVFRGFWSGSIGSFCSIKTYFGL